MVQHSSLPWPVCGMPAGWNIAQYLTVFVSGPFTKYAPCSPLQFFLLFLSSLSFPYGESPGDSRWDLCRCCHSRIDIFLDHKWPAPETIVDGNYSYNRTL